MYLKQVPMLEQACSIKDHVTSLVTELLQYNYSEIRN